MKHSLSLVFAVALVASCCARAQTEPAAAGKQKGQNSRMFVAPSSTTVALGKVGLSVSPLARKEKYYVGDYQIKVTPYFFKSEKGVLVLGNGEDLLGRLAAGSAVTFTGKATSSKDGKVKVVNGRATPTDDNQGAVSFSVITDNGPMAFDTSYRLGP